LKKRYGQHFISDRDLLQRIIELAHISSTDTVIEIGPGSGSLTRELAAVARRVVAIEIDRDLIGALRRTMPFNVEIVDADALGVDFEQYTAPYHVIGNLPYNVATVLLRNVLERKKELALLGAVGYRRAHVMMMVVAENVLLLVTGLTAGALSAAIAIAPAVAERGSRLPFTSGSALLMIGVLVTGLLSSVIAMRAATRMPLLASLRSE